MDKYLGTTYGQYILQDNLQVQRSNHRKPLCLEPRCTQWQQIGQSTLNSSIQLVPKHYSLTSCGAPTRLKTTELGNKSRFLLLLLFVFNYFL